MSIARHGRRDVRIRVRLGRVDRDRLCCDTPVRVRYSRGPASAVAAGGKVAGCWCWLYCERLVVACPDIN